MEKYELYNKLVDDVRHCVLCDRYTAKGKNDNELVSLEHDTNRRQINLWTEWQGSLDADILLIGQDYGRLDYKGFMGEEYARHIEKRIDQNEFYCDDDNATDQTLIKHFRQSLGMDINTSNKKLFFTNSVLCYKTGSLSNETNPNWFKECNRNFISSLIKIIRPKVIITLGIKALAGLLHCGGLFSNMQNEPLEKSYFSKPINEIVDNGAVLLNINDFSITVCPVIHTCSREKYNRKGNDPSDDWNKIKKYI